MVQQGGTHEVGAVVPRRGIIKGFFIAQNDLRRKYPLGHLNQNLDN